jgi:hypothetical protein
MQNRTLCKVVYLILALVTIGYLIAFRVLGFSLLLVNYYLDHLAFCGVLVVLLESIMLFGRWRQRVSTRAKLK